KAVGLKDLEQLSFNGDVYTKDYDEFRKQVRRLRALGGGDEPESSLDAIVTAARQTSRKGALRILLLITDAPPHVPDQEIQTVAQAAGVLEETKVHQLHLVTRDVDREIYEKLRSDGMTGRFFDLQDAARGRAKFADILPAVSREIVKSI